MERSKITIDRPVISDAQKAEAQSRVDFARSVVSSHQKSHKKATIISLVVLTLVVGLVWLLIPGKTTPKTQSNTSHFIAQTKTQNKAPTIATQSYSSAAFGVSFNYPTNWAIVDSGNGVMTITSPPLQLNDASHQSVTGFITVTFHSQGQLLAAFTAGSDLAVLNSQTINYTQPTADQTADTYLSFVQYSSTSIKGGMDGVYVTGNYGYQEDQVIPSSDVASLNPLIMVTFTKCGNSRCTTNLTPLTIAASDWSDSSFQAPITTLLSSLSFQ
jgi:hypothetical protein